MKKNRFLRFVLTTAVWVSLGGTVAFAQSLNNKTVTLSIKQAKLGKILKSIQEKSATQIVYNGQLVDKVAAQTVVAKNEKLTDLLDRILKGTGLGYTIENNVIIIRPVRQSTGGVTLSISTTLVQFAAAQGKVQLANGQPKPLVTIVNKETGTHTLSDANGNFIINAKEGDHLQFSHVGFKPYQATVRNFKEMKVTLEEQESTLEEVVLTGYQTIEKKLSTGSIVTLKGKDVAEPNVPNIASMLQGKVPGLAIETLSGSPNSIPRMRMRGTSTLIGNANPIWVVNGIVRENPTDMNPDNPMGLNPDFLNQFLRSGTTLASADLMGNSIGGININDVESISFLKDAAATALYGVKAANGVILITTKKGKAGPSILNYSTSVGFVQKPSYKHLNLMNSKERVQLSRELINEGMLFKDMPVDLGYESEYLNLINGRITEDVFHERVRQMELENTDWFDLLFRNSFNQSHAVNLSGGSDNTTFYSSLNYKDNKGAAKNDTRKSFGGSLSVNSKLNKKLTIGFELMGDYAKAVGYNPQIINPMTYALTTSRTIPSDLFYESKIPVFGNQPPFSTAPLHFNALNEIDHSGNMTKTVFLNSALNLGYKISDELHLSSILSGNFSMQNSEQYSTERTFDVAKVRGYDYGSVVPGGQEETFSALPFGGILDHRNSNLYGYSWRNTLVYKRRLFNDRDQLDITLGQELNSTKREGYSQYQYGYLKDRGEGFAQLPIYYPWMLQRKENKIDNFLSGFVAASYAFKEKYIVSGSLRTDASNRFGQYTNSRFLPAWSVSGRWNVSDEPWLQNSKIIENLSLSGSYGWRGNAVTSVGPDLIMEISQNTGPLNPIANEYQLTMKSLAYPDLRWERSVDNNIAINFGLFRSLINVNAQFYSRKTHDAIIDLNVPFEYGVSSMYINGGTLTNKGMDLSVSLRLIRKQDWTWTVSGNTSKNKNNLTKGSDIVTYSLLDHLNGQARLPGQPLGTFYVFGFKGLDHETGTPRYNVIDDVEDRSKIGKYDYLIKAGTKNYPFTGGLSTTLRYRNLSLSMNFTFGLGAHKLRNALFNGQEEQFAPTPDQNVQRWLLDRWRHPGDELHTNIPRFANAREDQWVSFDGSRHSRYKMYDFSTVQLSKADYLKCRGLQFNYALPPSLLQPMHLSQASVTFSMSNVFTIASKEWKGQDPEILGVGSSALPQLPTYDLSINVSF
ncbi:Vitamin B12 transporter BtuB [compost metagenome]